jgi:hypothetical protein
MSCYEDFLGFECGPLGSRILTLDQIVDIFGLQPRFTRREIPDKCSPIGQDCQSLQANVAAESRLYYGTLSEFFQFEDFFLLGCNAE